MEPEYYYAIMLIQIFRIHRSYGWKMKHPVEKYLAITDLLVGAHQSVPGRVGDLADSSYIRFQIWVNLV